jgi:hypothetical protein
MFISGFLMSKQLLKLITSELSNMSAKNLLQWPETKHPNRDVAFDLAKLIRSDPIQNYKPEGGWINAPNILIKTLNFSFQRKSATHNFSTSS